MRSVDKAIGSKDSAPALQPNKHILRASDIHGFIWTYILLVYKCDDTSYIDIFYAIPAFCISEGMIHRQTSQTRRVIIPVI
jgi:hypothetical protein